MTNELIEAMRTQLDEVRVKVGDARLAVAVEEQNLKTARETLLGLVSEETALARALGELDGSRSASRSKAGRKPRASEPEPTPRKRTKRGEETPNAEPAEVPA